ncbi:MAG: hypothetical protein HWN66_07435 [Candidatus Helarchaeota archaeon]|nr:hypothetical protein [Candidatus Helarchaeota archaeon]
MTLGTLDWIAIGCWIVVVIITAGIFIKLFLKYLKYPERVKNRLAFCLVFLFLVIGRCLLIYFDYFLVELDTTRYGEFQMMWKMATLFQLMGIGFLIVVSEYAVFNGKDYYVFFIGFTIVVFIGLLIQDFLLAQNITVGALGFLAFIPISWIYLIRKLPETRNNMLMILMGFIIYGGGLLIISAGLVPIIEDIFLISVHEIYLISPLIQIPGLLILGLGIKRMYFAD